MTDDLAAALDAVEATETTDEQEPDATPTEIGADTDADLPDESTSKDGGLWDWATSVPDGSHREWDRTDLWDPEGGGRARLAFHVGTRFSDGTGLPNGLGVLLGVVEMYWNLARQANGSAGGDRGETPDPDAETVAREQAEGYV